MSTRPMSESLGLPTYVAPQLPEITPPVPPPSAVQVGGGGNYGPTSLAGGLAGMGDSFLRGWMRGKATSEANKAIKLKKQSDDMQAAYNMAAVNLQKMHESGVDPNSDEYKQAVSAVQGAWTGLMGFYGQHIAPENTGQKKSKGQKVKGGLAAMFGSQDPMQISGAYLQLMQQMGPPILHQLQSEDPAAIKRRKELSTTNEQIDLQKKQDELRGIQLAAKDRAGQLTPDEQKEYEKYQEAGETPQQTNQRLASQIVMQHMESQQPYSQQEAQSLTALTGHQITPKSVTMKNPKTGEVAIATPGDDGQWTWATQQVFEPTPGGRHRGGGGAGNSDHIDNGSHLPYNVRIKLTANTDTKEKAFEKARQALSLPAGDPLKIDRAEYVKRLQAAQDNYEKKGEQILGKKLDHFDVNAHIDDKGNWISGAAGGEQKKMLRAYVNGQPVDDHEYTEEEVSKLKNDPELKNAGVVFK